MRRSVFAVSAAVALHAPRTAGACSCGPLEGVFAAPQLGTNVEATYVYGYRTGEPLHLRDITTEQDVIIDDPVVVEGYRDAATGLSRLALPPLAAGHSYQLYREVAGTPDGIAEFTVDAGPDTLAPAMPLVMNLSFAVAPFAPGIVSSCGPALASVNGRLGGLDQDSLVVVRLTSSNGTTTERLLLPQEYGLRRLGMDVCSVDLPLEPGARYEIAISTRDLAGNESEPFRQMVLVRDCGTIRDYGDVEAASECVYENGPPVSTDVVDGAPMPDAGDGTASPDGGGCATGGEASPLAWLALLARRRGSKR